MPRGGSKGGVVEEHLTVNPAVGRLPIPDPTVLTTVQLHREIQWVRELIQTEKKNTADLLHEITASQKLAVEKAEAGNERRFESINEFRGQMADQASRFISREEALAVARANAEKIEALTDRINRNEGRGTGVHQFWGYIMGGVGLAAALATVIITALHKVAL